MPTLQEQPEVIRNQHQSPGYAESNFADLKIFIILSYQGKGLQELLQTVVLSQQWYSRIPPGGDPVLTCISHQCPLAFFLRLNKDLCGNMETGVLSGSCLQTLVQGHMPAIFNSEKDVHLLSYLGINVLN